MGYSPGKNSSLDVIAIIPGQCAELGGKSYIQVQSGAGPQTNMFYQRFPSGTFPVVYPPPVTPASDNAPTVLPPGTPAEGTPDTAVGCAPFKGAGPARDESTFAYFCSIQLPTWGHYRICFGKNYVERLDGNRSDWPYKLMLVGINEKPISRPGVPTDGTNPRFNATNAETCRDYYDVNNAFLLVGGEAAPWFPKDIKAIHMSISPISGK